MTGLPGVENECIFFPGRAEPSVRAFADFCGDTASAYPGMATARHGGISRAEDESPTVPGM